MINNKVVELDSYLEVDDVFNQEENAINEVPLIDEKLSKRRQVEDLLEKKRLRAELEDF